MSLKKEIEDFLHGQLEALQSKIVEEFENIQILVSQIPILPKQKASMASLLIIQESLQNIKSLLAQQRSTASELVKEIEEIDDQLASQFAKFKSEMEEEERKAIEKTRELEEFYEREMKSIEQAYQKSLQDDQKYIALLEDED